MRPLVSRILTDRFWQAGISEGTKEDFYARVSGTKSTMEGFASSIRGSIRTVREACYSILWCMSRLDVDFYGFSELPGPLAHALFSDAHCLSSHQLIALLNVVRYMVDDCPVEVRSHFVPPILATCFTQMDGKISSEWDKQTHKEVAPSEEDNLTEEMKEASILRQLTNSAVMMIGGFLDPARASEYPHSWLKSHQLTVHRPSNCCSHKQGCFYICCRWQSSIFISFNATVLPDEFYNSRATSHIPRSRNSHAR